MSQTGNLTEDLQSTLESAGQSVTPPIAPNLGGVKARAAQRRRRRTQGTALGVSLLVAVVGGAALLLSQPEDDSIFLDTDTADQVERSTSTSTPSPDRDGDEGAEAETGGADFGPPAAIAWTPTDLDSPIREVVWTGDRYLAAQVSVDDGEERTAVLSSPDGEVWTRLAVEPEGPVGAVAGYRDELALVVTDTTDGITSGVPESVHYSDDGGATWTELDVLFGADHNPVSPYVIRQSNVESLAVRNGTVLVSGSQYDRLDVPAVLADRADFDSPISPGYEQTRSSVSVVLDDGTEVTFPVADLDLTEEERRAFNGDAPASFLLRSAAPGEPLAPVPQLDAELSRVLTVDDGFVGVAAWVGSIWSSQDGVTWERIRSAPNGFGHVAGYGNRLALIDWSTPTVRLRVSEDGGATWTTSELPVAGEDLTSVAIGPAGIALLAVDDVADGFEPDLIQVEKDGYRVDLGDDAVVTDLATGEVVLRVSEDEATSGLSDVVEIGAGGTSFTFFDRETGEELLTVTQADVMDVLFDNEGIQVLWSTDGTEWAPLDLGDLDGVGSVLSLNSVAIGEDGLVVGGLTDSDDQPVTVVGRPLD